MRSPTSAIQNGCMLAKLRKASVEIQQVPSESWQVLRARLPDYHVVDVLWTLMTKAGNPRSLREDIDYG